MCQISADHPRAEQIVQQLKDEVEKNGKMTKKWLYARRDELLDAAKAQDPSLPAKRSRWSKKVFERQEGVREPKKCLPESKLEAMKEQEEQLDEEDEEEEEEVNHDNADFEVPADGASVSLQSWLLQETQPP